MAAVSIAKMIGARIYTTAGSDAKREMLSRLGVEYVGDSRSVDFADEILELTDGYGVDVVLNSLAGEAIQRGVQILAPGGRFIELGKKDVYADASLGLAALAKSASFSVVDLDLNLKLQPARYRQLLQHILQHVADGKLEVLPSPHLACTMRPTHSGLWHPVNTPARSSSRYPSTAASRRSLPRHHFLLVSRDGGYLIVGGMGGLGFVVARWLAEQGAGLIVLNGRSAPSDEVAAAIAELNASGSRIEVITGDITEPDTAERLVRAVEDAGFRLAGVVHSAMVLADEIVLSMTDSAARRVFAPKVTGSWRLHVATAARDVDWWLTFSSAAALLGTPGQGAPRRRQLVGRRPGRASALGRTSRCRDQLGPVGRRWTRAVLQRPRGGDDQRRAGACRHAGGTHRRSRAHRCVQPRRAAVVPIVPRCGGVLAVREAA